MTTDFPVLAAYPDLARIAASVVSEWPEHADFLRLRFDDARDSSLAVAEEMAGLVLKLAASDLARHCGDYRWMCGNFLREDIHFRKTGRYRLATFEEAYDEVYGRPEYMSRYIRGILLSQVLWFNQARAMQYYLERFLVDAPVGSDFLEVGPGHGLYLYFAARDSKFASITGWDVSQSSIDATRQALHCLGTTRPIDLRLQSILDPDVPPARFDAIVISEVLEHLDAPEAALKTLFAVLRPGGRIYINVPVNSPAPDHIYLWNSPEEVVDLVRGVGFSIVATSLAPVTGHSVEQARRRKVTLNSLIIASRPASETGS